MNWLYYVLVVSAMFVVSSSGRAAACDVGYYVEKGNCVECTSSMFAYCPDGVNKVDCPPNNTNYGKYISGATVDELSGRGTTGVVLSDASYCHSDVYLNAPGGKLLWQCKFNGTDYSNCGAKLWYEANTGYYLSGYDSTSFKAWYNDVKPCTNAPRNSYYTGAGTPQRSSTAVEGDCPWGCDSGYERHGSVCTTLCTAGFTQLKTSSGVTVNVYADKPSTPALNISTSRGTCYVTLAAGAANNAINVNYNGTTYHTTD